MSSSETTSTPAVERKPQSGIAKTYEIARADERKVLCRKFARWLDLDRTRRRSYDSLIEAVAGGEWLVELNEYDLSDKDSTKGGSRPPKKERK
jgi:hypothetical protein